MALLGVALAWPALAWPALGQAQSCEGFITGGGSPPPRWEAAEGGALTEASRLRVADRYPICVLPAPVAADVQVTLRFKPLAGQMDRAGGVAVRVQDANTYYVLRANAAEDNVRLYHVTNGRRVQFAGREGVPMALGQWHTLRLLARGQDFSAWLDGAPMFVARDARISAPGQIALWSIADSHTLFEPPVIEVLQ
jgi:hypothetical protein